MNLLKNKYFILGNIILLLAVIPLTLFVVKSQTNLRSKATASTTLSFDPTSGSVAVGSTTSFDIYVNPGQNLISIVDLVIQVSNPDQLTITSLTYNTTAFPVKLKEPAVSADGSSASMSVSATQNSVSTITGTVKTKVGTITVKGKAPTSGTGSIIKFDKQTSQVFSLATADGVTENVLNDASSTVSVTVTGTAATTAANPVCSALNLDRSANGTAPYSITFTGVGTSTSGTTISNAIFTFGDSTSQNVTTAGGIGTSSVSVQIAHTYTIPGNYSANVVLTDNTGKSSTAATCTKAIVISAVGSGSGGGTGTTTVTPTTVATIPTAIVTAAPTTAPATQNPAPVVPATGSIETTFAILGGVGISLVIGVLLFVL